VKTNSDAEQLQQDLDKLGDWEKKWSMEFHPKKCQVLSITKNRNIIRYPYELHGHQLEHVEEAKYLGVTITKDFSWNTHIEKVITKASRTLGFLKRNLQSGSTDIKERAYKALVRPLLEYSPCIWDPYTTTHKNKIEMVQRRAARYVLNRYHNTSSVTEMMNLLKWPLLQTRRQHYRLIMMYKISNNMVDLEGHKNILTPLTRIARRYNSKAYYIPDSSKSYMYTKFVLPKNNQRMEQPARRNSHLSINRHLQT
jgi:hypothetical protein